MIGRFVSSASSVARLVVTPAGRMLSWNQLTTSSHPSGSFAEDSARHLRMRCWNSSTVSDA